jgi:hypothetical protein
LMVITRLLSLLIYGNVHRLRVLQLVLWADTGSVRLDVGLGWNFAYLAARHAYLSSEDCLHVESLVSDRETILSKQA